MDMMTLKRLLCLDMSIANGIMFVLRIMRSMCKVAEWASGR